MTEGWGCPSCGGRTVAMGAGVWRCTWCGDEGRNTGGKDMVVIALTGWGQEEDRKRSKEAGFNAHFVKPLEREALMLVLAGKYPAAA